MLHHWPRLGVFDAGRLDWKKVRAGGFSAVFRKVNPCNYLRENSVVYGKCGSLTNEGLRAQLRPTKSGSSTIHTVSPMRAYGPN